MKQPLEVREVREFDRIVPRNAKNANLDGREGYAVLPEDTFRELEAFILDYTSVKDNADAVSFFCIQSQRSVGKTICVSHYVGLIQLKSGQQIQILPKIDFDVAAEDRTKAIFLRMLRSVKRLPAKMSGTAHLDVAHMTIYEIFIRLYVQAVGELLRKGLKSAYLRQEANLPFYKGKLVFSEHIKRNAAHQERFYVAFDEYHRNRAENRLIKSTLLKLQRVTGSAKTDQMICQQLGFFEDVEPSDNYHKDFSRIVLDRSTREYETLLEWSRVFLFDEGFTTFSGAHRARALLFPMEKLFEAYVAKHLKRVLDRTGWRVTAQDRGTYLFDDDPQRQLFALRPDIVLRSNDKRTIVLDTKWKRLVNQPRKNYGISQADMYQMYVYAKKYHAPEVWLLYPQTETLREPDDFNVAENRQGRLPSFRSKFNKAVDVTVRVFFVDVANIDASLTRLRSLLGISVRQEEAV